MLCFLVYPASLDHQDQAHVPGYKLHHCSYTILGLGESYNLALSWLIVLILWLSLVYGLTRLDSTTLGSFGFTMSFSVLVKHHTTPMLRP